MPDYCRVLPRIVDFSLPVQLPFDLPFDLPNALTGELSSSDPLTWVIAGGALALIGLFALRRVRRMVVILAVGTAGVAWAWSSGVLPLTG